MKTWDFNAITSTVHVSPFRPLWKDIWLCNNLNLHYYIMIKRISLSPILFCSYLLWSIIYIHDMLIEWIYKFWKDVTQLMGYEIKWKPRSNKKNLFSVFYFCSFYIICNDRRYKLYVNWIVFVLLFLYVKYPSFY